MTDRGTPGMGSRVTPVERVSRHALSKAVAPQRQRVPNGELTDGETGCLPEVLYGRPVCGPLNDYL